MHRQARRYWNYRVMRVISPELPEEPMYQIHEVHYEGDKPRMVMVNPAPVMSEDVAGMRWVLDKMREALDKPVLDYETLEEVVDSSANQT
jgi:hypothetical protein